MTDFIITYKDGLQRRFSYETYDMAMRAFDSFLNNEQVAEITIVKGE